MNLTKRPQAINDLRDQATSLFNSGIAAADPYKSVKRYMLMAGGKLQIALNEHGTKRSGDWRKIHIIAFGKAACLMMQAALDIIPTALIGQTVTVTNDENVKPITGANVIGAAHPVPNEAGLQAAKICADIAGNAKAGELVLVLISGGGSALLPFPVNSVSLQDKITTTQLLLASGANINEINCIRKHLSRLKGGGLARLIAPADYHALILSDVIGDDLSAIASGPTVSDETTFADAINILQHYHLWQKVPEAIRHYLESGLHGQVPETPKPNDDCFTHAACSLIGSNRISLNAVMNTAHALNFDAVLYSDTLCGEAKDAAQQLAEFAQQQTHELNGKTIAIVAGGETTVTITGRGKGGRNQEMALAFAIYAEQIGMTGNWVFLSGGTDGRDGPTDAAGGLVDSVTITRMVNAGIDPVEFLANNDSYTALKQSDNLLITGATGTNVADLQILLLS